MATAVVGEWVGDMRGGRVTVVVVGMGVAVAVATLYKGREGDEDPSFRFTTKTTLL